jgi:uncharacterized protein
MQPLAKFDHPKIVDFFLQPPPHVGGERPANAEDLHLTVSPGIHLTCRFYCAAFNAPTLIYFHGGGESSESFNAEAQSFIELGLNLFLTSFRGFGKSTGPLSLATINEDAQLQFSYATKWLAEQKYSGPTFIMGRSLGSVCALDVTHSNSDMIKGLILESAFCQTLPLLMAIGEKEAIEEITENEGFCNLQKITGIKIPTLIFHGSRDTLVPVAQAEKLQAASAAKNKQFLVIPGAEHHNVSKTGGNLYYKTIKTFIDSVCGINTWRQRRKKFRSEQTGEPS